MITVLLLLAFCTTVTFTVRKLYGGEQDHIFRPFPGFVLLASIFYLVGILAAPFRVEDSTILAVIIGLIGISLGTLFFTGLQQRPNTFGGRTELRAELNRSFPLKYVVFLASIGLVLTLYLWLSAGIPLFASDVNAARQEMVANGYIATLGTLLDVAATASYAFALTFKGKKKDMRYYIALTIVVVFVVVAILTGSRTRLAKLVVPAVLIRHFLYQRIPLTFVALVGVVGFVFIGALGYYRAISRWGIDVYEGLGISSVDVSLFDLVWHYALFEIYISIFGLQIVLNIIPEVAGYMHGLLHLGPFLVPFQIHVPNPGEYFKSSIGGTWSGFGLVATLFSPMYADLGYGGVIGFSVFYGFVLERLYSNISKRGSYSPYAIIVYAVLYFFFVSGLRSDIVSFEIYWFVFVATSIGVLRKRQPQPGALGHLRVSQRSRIFRAAK